MTYDYSKNLGEGNPNYRRGWAVPNSPIAPIKNAWVRMRQVCGNPKHPKYHRYGGRGISVCDDWLDGDKFLAWALQSGWEAGLSIDRIDNNGNYCPENCHWVTIAAKSRKKSTNKISFDDAQVIRQRALSGESEYDLAKEYGVVHGTVWFIVNNFTHVPDGECTKRIAESKATPAPTRAFNRIKDRRDMNLTPSEIDLLRYVLASYIAKIKASDSNRMHIIECQKLARKLG